MPKRKMVEDEDGDFSDVQEDFLQESSTNTPVSVITSKKAPKEPRIQKKMEEHPIKRSKAASDANSDESFPTVRRGSPPNHTGNTANSNLKIMVNSEGEKYLDLGKKKRAVVRSFKGVALLDIREYYGNDGEEKPGKKGISLTLEQWKSLQEGLGVIDQLFAQLGKK